MPAWISWARIAKGKAWAAILVVFYAVFALKTKKEAVASSDLATALGEAVLEVHHHPPQAMIKEEATAAALAADRYLALAHHLIPSAINMAHSATGFPTRWKSIISKLEQLPHSISDLSTHPCFNKNTLCSDHLRSVCDALTEVTEAANNNTPPVGKLQMQSNLDALSCKLDLILRDCNLLVKTGVLAGTADTTPTDVCELLARLQIGHAEAKHRAIEDLLQAMQEDEKSVLSALTRSNVSALLQLLTGAISPKIREKAASVVCLLVDSGSCEDLLISEGLIPALVKLAESGTPPAREKAVISLQRLSMLPESARAIITLDGVITMIEIVKSGDSISQTAAAGILKNLSAVPDLRQALAEEGVIGVIIGLLSSGILMGAREYAAECLQNLTASNDNLRRSVISEGGLRRLLAYLDGLTPQESAMGAVRNLVGALPAESLIALGLLPRLVHVLKDGSPGAQQAAATAICRISGSPEIKKLVGEVGCIPYLVRMLEAKGSGAREAAAQAISMLVSCPQNGREIKRSEKCVPSLVQLLDPSPHNSGKKYAVASLLWLASSKKCRKLMVSYGGVGYLKKLSEMEVPGAKKLLERIERGRLRRLFSKK